MSKLPGLLTVVLLLPAIFCFAGCGDKESGPDRDVVVDNTVDTEPDASPDTEPDGAPDIEQDGAPDIVPDATAAAISFEEVDFHGLEKLSDWGFELLTGDLNGNGRQDAVIISHQPVEEGTVWIYRNNGDFTFELRQRLEASEGNDLLLLDINNDLALDLIFAHDWLPLDLFVNTGEGEFEFFAQSVGESTEIAFSDLDGDGDLDLMAGTTRSGGESTVWRNNGSFQFLEEMSGEIGLESEGPSANILSVDFNEDGLPDTFWGVWTYALVDGFPVIAYQNPDGTFEKGVLPQHASFNGIPADYNRDGHMDLLFFFSDATVPDSHPVLFLNDGDANFTTVNFDELGLPSAISSVAIPIDFNNDGFPELITYGYGRTNRLFLNTGGAHFEDITEESGFIVGDNVGYVLATSDLDNDGDIDIIAMDSHNYGDEEIHVLENTTTGKNWVKIKLICDAPNTRCVGARVTIYEADHMDDPLHLLGYDEVKASYNRDLLLHFGLGEEDTIDIATVFPDQEHRGLVGQDANTLIEIVQ